MQPKSAPVPTEAQVRAQLVVFLRGWKGKTAVLRLFDSPAVERAIPDPTLRASFVALDGTVAEPLMKPFLARPIVTVWAPTARRQLIAAPGSAIVFAKRYQGEHFALLSGIFAHELLHHDFPTSATEEVLLHAVSDSVHLQLLSRRPELATGGTELSRFMNSLVLFWINSRSPGSSTSAILAPGGRGTAPGSAVSRRDLYGHGSYFHSFGQEPSPSDTGPAPPAYASVLRELLAPGVALPKPLTYSKKTAQLFARMNDTWLSPAERLRVSVLLGLVSVEEITSYTGLSRAKAVSTFGLAPVLAAMR